jgi:hypothetical protein
MQDDSNHRKSPSAPEPGTAAGAPGPAERTPPKRAPREIGGPRGPEPTRFGDWERGGRCIDF